MNLIQIVIEIKKYMIEQDCSLDDALNDFEFHEDGGLTQAEKDSVISMETTW